MKKVIIFATVLTALAARASLADACGETERALSYHVQTMGRITTIEKHAKAARIYSEMANKGCRTNKQKYKQQAQAQIKAARGLVEIADFKDKNRRLYYEDIINKAAIKTF